MQGYRVCFPQPETAKLETFDVREPKENEAVVKMEFTAVSAGTEKANFVNMPNTLNKFPQYPGYTGSGIIVKIGKSVKEFSIGDRVVVTNGGHASYSVKEAYKLFKVPEKVAMSDAAFTRIISFPLHAIRLSRLEIGESVVIVGLGLLGQFAVQIARAAGALPLFAVGNRQIRREKALGFGADYAFDPNDPELTEKIISASLAGTGANVIIETSGATDALESCLKYAAKLGRVLLNGCNRVTDRPIDFYKYVHRKGVSIIGAHDMTRNAFNSAAGNWTYKRDCLAILAMLNDGRINAAALTSEIASPDTVGQLYERLAHDREFPLGVVINWKDFE